MKTLFALLLPFVLAVPARAQDCPDLAPYAKAREVIRDLDRIVAPGGVQEAYATKIGGIDQWLAVRGQDRHNPMILFVHGGPASPVTPTLWQFERPLEEVMIGPVIASILQLHVEPAPLLSERKILRPVH